MEPAASIHDGLTEAQRAAVTHTEGPLLVLAGPGSGKTTVVTRRVAYLIEQGIPPWQILSVTFTNKAAQEMRGRIDALVDPTTPGRRGLTIATFHALCARLLRQWGDQVGIDPRFTIYDAADQRDAIKRSVKEAELGERNFTPGAVAAVVSQAKNRLLDAAGYQAEAGDFYTRSIARAYVAYERRLRANNAVDFDDLLLFVARILRSCEEARTTLQERYQYLLVDEYQDTNHAQFVIAGSLASSHRNICVVGDPDQSIYGWRGADIRNILEFEEQYPETRVIPLGQNFRSTGHIVAVADHLIRHNRKRKHKTLFTELEDGTKPVTVVCRDEQHEAATIVEEMRTLNVDQGIPWREMAVLYRMNALSRVLEDAFRDAQIPYVIARGTAFYERKEIKDALAYLRLLVNPRDEVSFRRVINTPTRGIGKTTLQRLEHAAMGRGLSLVDAARAVGEIEGLTPRAVKAVRSFVSMLEGWQTQAAEPCHEPADLTPLVERVVRESGLKAHYRSSKAEEDLERLENLEELINAAATFRAPPADVVPDAEGTADGSWTILDRLAAFLESVALVSDADVIDPARGAVTLMTLHAAKGLEFDVVAIVALEGGVLPHMRAIDSESELEEERRLCFVGMTRARRHLRLTRAMSRTHRGLRERRIESQFLTELPDEHVVHTDRVDLDHGDPDGWGGGSTSPATGVGRDFPPGAYVRHPTFGVGRIDFVTPRPSGASARVTFHSVGQKTLILEYAKLERIDEIDAWDTAYGG